MKTSLSVLVPIALWLVALRSRTTATIASEDHSRLDQLHVEDGGERLHFGCRSDAGREMELQAPAGRVHRCALLANR